MPWNRVFRVHVWAARNIHFDIHRPTSSVSIWLPRNFWVGRESTDKHKSIISIISICIHFIPCQRYQYHLETRYLEPSLQEWWTFKFLWHLTLTKLWKAYVEHSMTRDDDLKVRGSGKICQINNDWFDVSPPDFLESWRWGEYSLFKYANIQL